MILSLSDLLSAISCLFFFQKRIDIDEKGKEFDEITHEGKHDPARSKDKAS